jgi:hypothetical protein
MEKNENNNGTMKLSGIYTLTIDMSNVKNIRLYAVKSENGQDSDDQTTSDVDFRVISSCLGSYNLENSSDLGDIQVAVDIINKEGKLNSTRFDRYQYDYTLTFGGSVIKEELSDKMKTTPYFEWDPSSAAAGEYILYVRVKDTDTNETVYFKSTTINLVDGEKNTEKKSGLVWFENTATWSDIVAELRITESSEEFVTVTPMFNESIGRYSVEYTQDGTTYNYVTFKSESNNSNNTNELAIIDNVTYNNGRQRVYDVYFLDDQDWGSDKLHVYMWNEASVNNKVAGIKNADWPGDSNVKDTGKSINSHKIYRYSYTDNSYDQVIFNSGINSSQTPDLTVNNSVLYYSKNENGSNNIYEANYDNQVYDFSISSTDNSSIFYLGDMQKEDSDYLYKLTASAGTVIDGKNRSDEIVYAWVKFENYQNPDGKTNYATGKEITKLHYWTREENADNNDVKDNTTNTMDTRCFNPSYYRLYMYIPKEAQSDKSNVIRRYTNYTAKDFVQYEATNDHGAQGAIDFDSDYIVARTSVAINPDGVTTQVADMIFGENEENLETEYYNLNGIKMKADNLTPGLYIMRRGEKAVKILIK